MTVFRICVGSERGDLQLGDNKHTSKEDGKRNYSHGENLLNYTEEYCSSGTIHGIRYFGERRTLIEKLWWAISILLSLSYCMYLMSNTYIKWQTSPVIVSFATKETPVWMIPFPAVTICPESKTRTSVFNYTYYLHRKQDNLSLTDDEERKFGYLSYICDTNLDVDYKCGKFADERMLDFFEEVQPNFYENSFDCRFLAEKYNCSELFVPIITDDGICYTFNMMDRTLILSNVVAHHKHYHKTTVTDDWNIEWGYKKTASIQAYPRRALYAGIPYALEIKLKVHEDDLDYTCGTSVKGFKVEIANPEVIPRVKHQHFVVPVDKVAKAGIAPIIMTTSHDVQHYSPQRRNCQFPSERPLKFFSVYTQTNCVIECRANYTLQQCGCVPFYVPRETGTLICGAGSHHCLTNAIHTMQRGDIQKKINKMSNIESNEFEDIPDCKCLPICTSMQYDIENTQAEWDWRTTYKHNRHPSINLTDKKLKMSMLQVFFKGNQFINSERNELYGFTDFLANIGGLLGLFIGFSTLSLIEIIYYLSLRIFCNIGMFGKGNWGGKTE